MLQISWIRQCHCKLFDASDVRIGPKPESIQKKGSSNLKWASQTHPLYLICHNQVTHSWLSTGIDTAAPPARKCMLSQSHFSIQGWMGAQRELPIWRLCHNFAYHNRAQTTLTFPWAAGFKYSKPGVWRKCGIKPLCEVHLVCLKDITKWKRGQSQYSDRDKIKSNSGLCFVPFVEVLVSPTSLHNHIFQPCKV